MTKTFPLSANEIPSIDWKPSIDGRSPFIRQRLALNVSLDPYVNNKITERTETPLPDPLLMVTCWQDYCIAHVLINMVV